MPISPNEARKINNEHIQSQIDKAILVIDKKLLSEFYGDNTVRVIIDGSLHKKAVIRLTQMYANAGWDVTVKTDSHRNESHTTFTFKENTSQYRGNGIPPELRRENGSS